MPHQGNSAVNPPLSSLASTGPQQAMLIMQVQPNMLQPLHASDARRCCHKEVSVAQGCAHQLVSLSLTLCGVQFSE
jgi:hypothetical protein